VSESTGRRPDLWARVWLLLVSNRLLIIWLGLLALSGLVALWFPQIPRSTYLQERGLERWLTAARAELGSPTDLLLALGLLSVERSAWFRIILAGTAFSLLLRSVDCLTRLVRPGRWIPDPHLAQTVTLPGQPHGALEAIKEHLIRNSDKLRSWEGPGQRLVATQPLAPLGPLCLSLGGLLLIAGWVWTQVQGWQASDLFVTVNTPATVMVADATLRLEDFEVQWQDGIHAYSAYGRLRVSNHQQESSGGISLESPWRWRGTTYELTNVGPAVHVSGNSPGGMPMLFQVAARRPPVDQITLALPADDNVRSFAAPEQGIVVQVEAVTGERSPRIHVRIYLGQAGELIEDRMMDAQAFVLIGGSQLALTMIPFAEITATYTPGRPLAISGAILVIAGAILALVYPRRDVQVMVEHQAEITYVTIGVSGAGRTRYLATLAQVLVKGESEGNES
jgi:hypothetical protein